MTNAPSIVEEGVSQDTLNLEHPDNSSPTGCKPRPCLAQMCTLPRGSHTAGAWGLPGALMRNANAPTVRDPGGHHGPDGHAAAWWAEGRTLSLLAACCRGLCSGPPRNILPLIDSLCPHQGPGPQVQHVCFCVTRRVERGEVCPHLFFQQIFENLLCPQRSESHVREACA